MNKTYCEKCRSDIEYITKEILMVSVLKGVKCSFTGKIANCKQCGNPVYTDEINDYNIKQLYNDYCNRYNQKTST
jgi:hypothetical protein